MWSQNHRWRGAVSRSHPPPVELVVSLLKPSEVTHATSTQALGERSDTTALPRLVCARTSRFGPAGRVTHRTTHLAQRPELRSS